MGGWMDGCGERWTDGRQGNKTVGEEAEELCPCTLPNERRASVLLLSDLLSPILPQFSMLHVTNKPTTSIT